MTSATITPEQAQFLETPQDIYIPGPLTKAQAIHLDALGQPKKARRLESCGVFAHYQKCANSHVTLCTSNCGTRGCPKCAKLIAEALEEEYRITFDHRAKCAKAGQEPGRFTFLEMQFNCDWNPKSISAVLAFVKKTLAKITPLKRILTDTYKELARWTYAAGFLDNGKLLIRVLSVDDGLLSSKEIKDAFPGVDVTVSVMPTNLIMNFLKPLFAPCLPLSPEKRAEMEVAFTGVRRLRSMGLRDSGLDELLVEDNPASTNNSTDDSIHQGSQEDSPPHRCGCCSKCGARIVAVSRQHRTLDLPRLLDIEWCPT